MKKYTMIDLFAGCGGLTDGFMQTNKFEEVAAVEWLKPQVNTLRNRLKTKWNKPNVEDSVMHFDIQREEELYNGWTNDKDFNSGKGLDYFVSKVGQVDVIIGGPPCQAYSVAGRVRDKNGMKDDYRNYLFEHYLNVVNRYRPSIFVFENVPGLLSAIPGDIPIPQLIQKGFTSIDYDIIDNLKLYCKINASDYEVPQNRNRLIIVGIDRKKYGGLDTQNLLKYFYTDILPKYKSDKKLTVKEAVGDLKPCLPFYDNLNHSKKISHSTPDSDISWQIPRYSNLRDMDTFKTLAEDISSGKNEYDSKKISKLYEEKVGTKSPILKYHVLNPDKPSTTIVAHLYKDGNRFIHYDPIQSRTITVREAARLQSFDDDFDFIGSRGSAYQMIGNAVPPKLAKNIGHAIADFISYCDSKL